MGIIAFFEGVVVDIIEGTISKAIYNVLSGSHSAEAAKAELIRRLIEKKLNGG